MPSEKGIARRFFSVNSSSQDGILHGKNLHFYKGNDAPNTTRARSK